MTADSPCHLVIWMWNNEAFSTASQHQPPLVSYAPNTQLTSEPLCRSEKEKYEKQRLHEYKYLATRHNSTWGHRLVTNITVTWISLLQFLREGRRVGEACVCHSFNFCLLQKQFSTNDRYSKISCMQGKVQNKDVWTLRLFFCRKHVLFSLFYLDRSTISDQAQSYFKHPSIK